jgi:hypothetical protein
MLAPSRIVATRKELRALAARLDQLAAIFRRKSDAAPVSRGAEIIAAAAAGTLIVEEPERAGD